VCVFRLFHRGLIKQEGKRDCVYNSSARRVSLALRGYFIVILMIFNKRSYLLDVLSTVVSLVL